MTGNRKKSVHAPMAAWIVILVMGLGACASTPPPTGALDTADVAIAQARSARAAEFAPVELGFAETKRSEANAAISGRDNDRARTLALQAEADAALALAKSRAAMARAEVQKRTAENAALRRELLGEGATP